MRSIPCHVLGTAVVVALMLRGSTVEAQPATPPISASEEAQAKKLIGDAIAAHKAQNYATAIALYKQAYHLLPLSSLHFNIATSYRMAGNLVEAEKFYRRYLALDPHGERVQTALDMLDWISKQRPAVASAPPPPQPQPQPQPQPSASTSTGSSSSASKANEVPEAATPPPTRTSGTPPGQELTRNSSAPLPAGEARVSTGADPERRPEQLEPAPTTESSDLAPPETYTLALRARNERMKQARRIRNAGYVGMVLGIAIGTALLINDPRDERALFVGASTLALGITGYALGERWLRDARAVAWSPVVGSGFAGVALAGRLP